MKTLYLDCFSGISGDMFVGALLDLGIVSAAALAAELDKLGLGGEIALRAEKTTRSNISCTDITVLVSEHAPHGGHHGRTLADILQLIESAPLRTRAKQIAADIFNRIGRAEAHIHNLPPEQVHFHEVGAADSIADIVSAAVLVDLLGIERVICSALTDGQGFVRCQHGLIPVPVPATAQLLAEADAPVRQSGVEGELITPTGAGIVAALAQAFGTRPLLTNVRIGYGAGKKTFDTPNLLRVFYGDDTEAAEAEVYVVEANIDDMTAEAAGFVLERLLRNGALDAYIVPITMKKSRPGMLLGVLCRPDDVSMIEDMLFTHTTTIGLRKHLAERAVLPRRAGIAHTEFGDIAVKLIEYAGRTRVCPEYDSAAAAADAQGVGLKEIFDAAAQCPWEEVQ